MKKVRINRAKWRSGGDLSESYTGEGDTYLVNDEGYRCCLGFACHQLSNLNLQQLTCIAEPGGLQTVIPLLNYIDNDYGWNCMENTDFSDECVAINDDATITSKQREYKLKRKFKANGIELEFYGEYK